MTSATMLMTTKQMVGASWNIASRFTDRVTGSKFWCRTGSKARKCWENETENRNPIYVKTKHRAEAIKKKELQRSMDHSAGSNCLWTMDKLWFICFIKWWFAIATLNSQRVIPNKWMVSSFNRTILCKWEDFPLPSSKKSKWCKWN
jgi:hypothetical protein